MHRIYTIWKELLDLLFPRRCVGCTTVGADLCEACTELIVRNDMELPENTFAPLSYHDRRVREAIHRLKFRGAYSIAQSLAPFLTEALIDIASDSALFDGKETEMLVIPVPLYKKKLRVRGFNQCHYLAQYAVKETHLQNLRIRNDVLVKHKETESQVKTESKHIRKHNIRDSFSVPNPEYVRNSVCVILDDVITTGATLRECEQVLKKAGARKVYCLAVAH